MRGQTRPEGSVHTRPRQGTYPEGEEEREPTHHLWADKMHSLRMYTEPDVSVQVRLKIPCQTMTRSRMRYAERQMGRASIVRVCKW